MESDLSRCLENEVMLLANIDHPNIVNLIEVFEDEVNVYIIQEFLSGGDVFY